MDRSWIPTAAGIVDIVAGIAGLFGVVALVFVSFIVANVPPQDEFPFYAVQALFAALAVLILILAVLAVVGGLFLLQRRSWGWAIAGAIAAALICPPLGVPGIILTVLAEPELRGR